MTSSATPWRATLSSFASQHAPFLVVLAIGALLRVYLLAAYRPVAGVFNDSVTYLSTSHDHLFSDANRMAGYPLFLRIVRYLVPELSAVVVVQHLLGVATAILLYVTVRRVIGGRWLAALPAGFFLVSGDHLLLEHSILTESLYTFLVTASVTGLVFAITTHSSSTAWPRLALLALSAAALGAAWTLRTVALPLFVAAAGWIFVVSAPPVRDRLISVAAFALPACALIATYITLQGALTGFWGVLPGAGWIMYMRAAPFADCQEFDPPSGTRFLCETTPVRARPGPSYYQFVDGPAIKRFGDPFQTNARGSSTLGRFARSAILGQPLDYLREVGRDAVRYIVPSAGLDRPYAGPGSDELDLPRRNPPSEEATIETAEAVGFDASSITVGRGIALLGDLQAMTRIGGLSLVVLLALGLFATLSGFGTLRPVAVLLMLFAVLQALVPAATISWGYRYGVVGMGLLFAAAALGIYTISARLRATAEEASAG
jgi:hypothetical protein